jgi:hypothetical protein
MPVYHRVCPSRSDKCLMASAGFKADAKTLQKTLLTRQVMYQHNHNKVMSCPAMAQLLSNTLYYKRFFPYYTFNLLGGLDTEGAWAGDAFVSGWHTCLLQCAHSKASRLRLTPSLKGVVCFHRQGVRVHVRRHRLVRAHRLLVPGFGAGTHHAGVGQPVEDRQPACAPANGASHVVREVGASELIRHAC